MSLFRRRRREMPMLNTASLPDLIFAVLFFFMIVTSMRSVPLMVKYTAPAGTELSKTNRKSHIIYVYIGEPLTRDEPAETGKVIQVNDKYCDIGSLSDEVERIRHGMSPEDARRMCVSIKADRGTDMGTITDVKMALRRAHAYRISYSAVDRASVAVPTE